MRRSHLVPILVLACVGCGGSADPDRVRVHGIAASDTLVASESAEIAYAIDLDVAPSGVVFVADLMADAVVAVDSTGTVTSFGRRGEGPDEFSGPFALRAEGTVLFVFDRGNGRLKRMSQGGAVESLTRTSPQASRSPPFILDDGGMLVSTGGIDSSLVAQFDLNAQPVRAVGEPVVPVEEATRFVPILEAIHAGEVPDRLRNEGIVVGNAAGDIWVALTAEGSVRRYAPDGSLLWETRVEEPEMDASRERFFRRNREEAVEGGFFPLRYFVDLEIVGDEVWVLLQTDAADPAVILSLGPDGRLTRRVEVGAGGGAVAFAVSPDQEWLFLFTEHDAQLLRARLGLAAAF